MKDYKEFPPVSYFVRVLKGCPKSALLYAQLWKKKGSSMRLRTPKKDVRKDYLVSPTVFRNLISPMMFLNVLHFTENQDDFQIQVLGPHTEE